jgi:hypothetical protein
VSGIAMGKIDHHQAAHHGLTIVVHERPGKRQMTTSTPS